MGTKNKELSICMTHYNRKSQLLNTLQSIQNQYPFSELVEIIIVDDVSEIPLDYKDFSDFDLDIKLITVQTNNKWWVNPCVSFNTAFNYISSSKTIIQNAECMHISNILEYAITNIKPGEYIAASALSLTKDSTEKITRETKYDEIDKIDSSWYCHNIHRPRPFNFCAMISTEDLLKIGGFNQKFSRGIYFDDDALLQSLEKNEVICRIEDSQLVYHQWHQKVWEVHPDIHELGNLNKNLFLNLQ